MWAPVLFATCATTWAFWASKPAVPAGGIACDDGWTAVKAEWIGDDYCDCADGTDEAMTSACARPGMVFVCVNEGFASREIPSSRVGDSVCDCCDGSDEAPGLCDNTCDEEAARERMERELRERERAVGLEKRAAYVAEWAAEVSERSADLEAARAEKELASQLVGELEPKVQAHDAAEEAHVAAQREEAEAAYAGSAEALFAQAQPHEIRAAAVRLATAAADIETLLDVVMHSAGLDDAVTDVIDDVEVLSLGVDANEALKAGDDAKYDELCASIAMALKLDAVPPEAARRVALEAARAARDVILRRDDPPPAPHGLAAKLVDVAPPGPDERPPPTAEATADRDALKAARDQLADADRRIADLDRNKGRDLGPDMAFGPIQDQCYRAKAGKYDYELCLFGRAKQDHTAIGTFDKWDDDYSTWHYKHGQYCAGVGSRELKVEVLCGDTEHLFGIEEAQTCKYQAKFKTPAACK